MKGIISMADAISTLIQTLWIFVYLCFVLTTGWVIMKGFRGYLPWHMKLSGRLGFGFIALMCAIALAPIIPIGATGLFKLIFNVIQINLFVAGAISTIVLMLSLFLISNKIYNTRGMEKSLDKMKLRLEKAKSIEKEMSGKTMMQRLLRPLNIIGIVVFISFVAIALINFRGFPDPAKNIQNATGNMISDLGLSMDDIKMACSFIQGYNETTSMPEGCVSPLELAQNFQEDILQNSLPVYTDSAIKTLIESESGESVELMYRIEYRQKVYALAITTKQSVCSATGSLFCGCINLGSLV